LWLARGDPGRAIAFADACLVVAEATQSRRNIVKGRRVKGEALLVQGNVGEAEEEIAEALRVAREVGNPAQVWKTWVAVGRLRRAQARPEDATSAYQEAIAVVEGMASGLSEAALRETLLASPQVVALHDAVALR
jgi:tetratricopeptide (TPR) repeat protein